MFLYNILLHASPRPASASGPGAFAACWVLADDPESAVHTAATAILDQNWIPGSLIHVRLVDPSKVSPEDDAREHVNEAMESGFAIVLHQFPPEAGDAPRSD